MPAKRILIIIPYEEKIWLDGYAKANKISLAEAVCQGIGLLKQGQRRKTYLKLVESTYGIWKKGEGLAYQQGIVANGNRFFKIISLLEKSRVRLTHQKRCLNTEESE